MAASEQDGRLAFRRLKVKKNLYGGRGRNVAPVFIRVVRDIRVGRVFRLGWCPSADPFP